MTDVRAHLDALESAGDLIEIGDRVHWADTATAVATEAATENGPAVVLSDTAGDGRLVAGAYGGPDRLSVRARNPWSRVAAALGLGYDAGYLELLDVLVAVRQADGVPETAEPAATARDADLRSLGLPAVGTADVPAVTLGIAATSPDRDGSDQSFDDPRWMPVRGSVHGSDRLRLTVPAKPVEDLGADAKIAVALGVPPAALVAATMRWIGYSYVARAPRVANALGPVPVSRTAAGGVPADSEVVVEATVTALPEADTEGRGAAGSGLADGGTAGEEPTEASAPWEDALETVTLSARVDSLATREDPLVPFSPIGAPMADGRNLLSVIESARLYGRVNNYWGIDPVEWVALPPEAGLGICLVASEILYAGFEWQLANTLFSFSRLFDKVVVLDTETAPMDLGRAFDDIWVKAHPANDWEFSDPEAPAATAPRYREDGTTGSNVYVNAAWDPRWDEEYIAPRVTFEASYPEDLREAVRRDWRELGFDHGPDHEPAWGGDTEGGPGTETEGDRP